MTEAEPLPTAEERFRLSEADSFDVSIIRHDTARRLEHWGQKREQFLELQQARGPRKE